jgi:hypothetical protein
MNNQNQSHHFFGNVHPHFSQPKSRLVQGLQSLTDGLRSAIRIWVAEDYSPNRAIIFDRDRSRLEIERYSFSLSPQENFKLGTPVQFEATLQPNTRIRPQRILTNAPVPNFVLLDGIQLANVNVLVGGTEDAYTYSVNGRGVQLDLPTLDPANRVTVCGSYTGIVPNGYEGKKCSENFGPVPPPCGPSPIDLDLYDTTTKQGRAGLKQLQIYFERDKRAHAKALKEYAKSPHPDRIREWIEPFSFKFIITFQGPSTIVGGL